MSSAALKFGSVCSGIEAASMAWNTLGWRAQFVSEIDKAACKVLAHHHSDVPNFGDMTNFKEWPDVSIDVLVGGTPCQSFSVAGMRRGLDDPRGSLMLVYGAIARKYRPAWLVWENVPGVLSSNGGRDFGAFLGMLAECGYRFAYRILDAQYFGLAQRRKRVFVVGYLGDWRPAAAVLLERHCLRGDSAPRRQTGKTAPTIPSRSTAGGGLGTDFDCDGGLVSLARCVTAGEGSRQDYETTTMVTSKANRSNPQAGDACHPLAARAHAPAIASSAVRRLTPRECERLQGFPDDYTLVPNGKGTMADGPRYKMLGNSMAVPVMRWIGERIEATRAIATQQQGER